jgi:tetratricopeptide (TPR) repeat protein
MAQESEMILLGTISRLLRGAFLVALCAQAPLRAGTISLPPEARQAMDSLYGGNPDAAIAIAHQLQQSQPDHPIGYLLEAESNWWKMYCAACEIKFGMVDVWRRSKRPQDEAYLALSDQVIRLAEASIAKSDTAEMRVYAGIGQGLKARFYSVRGENRNVARAGVASRAEMLRALQLDPQMADATAGLGFYNYYVDTLSAAVKILRFLMGIPGGNKQEGIRQMEIGMNQGVLLGADSRFYLAKNLRTFDLRYDAALSAAEPLAQRYPNNAIYQLLLGNLNQELGRRENAAEHFNQVLRMSVPDSACAIHVHDLADSFLATLR